LNIPKNILKIFAGGFFALMLDLEIENQPSLKVAKREVFCRGFDQIICEVKKQKRQHRAGALVIIN
jgi:hypothetical protein